MRPGRFDGKKLPELPFVFVGIAAVIIVVGVILELEIQDIGGKLALGVVGMVLLGFVRGSVGRRR